jgi:S1-C subfamily serine protease
MVDLLPAKKQELNQKKQLNIQLDVGVAIKGIVANSPGQKGGLLIGDVIQKINGKPIKSLAQAQKIIEFSTVGDIVTIEVDRNGKTQIFKIRSGTYPHK